MVHGVYPTMFGDTQGKCSFCLLYMGLYWCCPIKQVGCRVSQLGILTLCFADVACFSKLAFFDLIVHLQKALNGLPDIAINHSL